MQQISYDEGKKLTETHVCGECGSPLTLPWGGAYGFNSHVIRCGDNPYHTGIVKKSSYTSVYRKGGAVPAYIANNIERRQKGEMEQELGPDKAAVLAPYQGITSLTQQTATMILKTIWPDAPDIEVYKAALTCHSYGLNPLMKHLYLIPYTNHKTGETTWAQVLGIGATRLLASRKSNYGYADGPRRMSDQEQTDIFGEVDNTKIFAITVLQGPSGNKAPGYGSWPKDDEPKGTNKGNTKLNMAMIRSERNAFERLLPGEMPADMDVVDPQYAPLAELPEAPKPQGKIPRAAAPAASTDKATDVQVKAIDDLIVEIKYDKDVYLADIKARFDADKTEDLSKEQASVVYNALMEQKKRLL